MATAYRGPVVADLGGDAEQLSALAREVEHLADRVRSMSDVRLRQPLTRR